MSALEFVAYGRPAPQGSKRFGASGQAYEQSRYLPAWREAVKLAAQRARIEAKWHTVTVPCVLDLVFSVDRAEHPDPDRPWLDEYPAKPPDLDKLARGVADALTAAGVWADDALWVGCGWLWKLWVAGPPTPIVRGQQYTALGRAGCSVRVYRLSEMENDA